MREICINANLDPLTELTSSSGSTEFKDPPMNVSQMITKTIPISTIIFIILNCDETGHPLLSLAESQGKLRQRRDQNFPMEGKPL